MEAAVSPPPPNPSTVERFTRGEAIAVEVHQIERELSALWQEASRAEAPASDLAAHAPREATALSRAALWNVVVPVHGAESLRWTREMIDQVAPSVPARVLVLYRDEEVDSDPGAPESIHASIGSNVVSRPSGARTVYSEEITLTARNGGEQHFGALVRSLQIPSLPTAIFWIDTTLTETLLTRELLPVSERLVVDTARCRTLGDIRSIHRIIETSRTEVCDLGWARLDNFRLLFAGLFDPPVGGGPLQNASRVTIRHRSSSLTSGLMLGAWLARMMAWEPVSASKRPQGQREFRFRRSGTAAGAPEVILELMASDGECGTSGLVSMELIAAGANANAGRYQVTRTANNHARLDIPIAPPRVVKLDPRTTAELCVAALGPRGSDPLFRRCVSLAARMVDLLDPTGP